MNCAYSIRLQHDDAIAANTNNIRTTTNSGNRPEAWDQLARTRSSEGVRNWLGWVSFAVRWIGSI
jgi:hypothetical protein